jgi:hypothetical protein
MELVVEPTCGRVTRRWGRVVAVFCALVLLAATGLEAGDRAARSRPGGSGGGAAPQRASGRATYGYHSGGHSGWPGYPGGYPYWRYYGYWGAPHYWGWVGPPWGWWYAGWPYYVPAARPDPSAPGFVETDVRPKKADVLVDGEFVGQARDYNGTWNLLWLPPGDHVLDFRKDGYMTRRYHVRLRPGGGVRLTEPLQRGSGLDPRSSESPPPLAAPARKEGGTLERGLLRLRVEPGDAAIYLDGEFLARADELDRLHGALSVATGMHRIEVVRPGFASRTLEIDVGADEPARVELTLEQR